MFNRTTSIHFCCCRCRYCLSIFIFTLMRHWIPLLANMGGVYRTRNWIVCIHHACVCVCWCLWHNVCDAFYQLVWSVVYLYSIVYVHKYLCDVFLLGIAFSTEKWSKKEWKKDIKTNDDKQIFLEHTYTLSRARSLARLHTPFVFRFVNAFDIFWCLHTSCSPPILCVHDKFIYFLFFTRAFSSFSFSLALSLTLSFELCVFVSWLTTIS